VGAHQAHVNPTAAAALANPFSCSICHPSPLPTDVAHVDGSVPPVVFSGVAGSGTYDRTANPPTCSSTYCHGNFTGGKTTAAPAWTGGTLACNACHNMPTTSTNEHSRHMGAGLNCSDCHSGIATGTGNPSTNAAVIGRTLHVNGTANVVFAPANPVTTTGSGASRTCSGSCHGKNHSSERW
jgi:predicted CxxxxCH...CXXCH cytochrome family protein